MNVLNIFAPSPIQPPAPPLSDRDRLAEIEREYRAAENEYIDALLAVSRYNARVKDLRTGRVDGEVFILLGAMTHDVELQKLERNRNQARQHRNELLGKRADLMKSFGMI